MDDYPTHSLDQNVPLLVVLGLSSSFAQQTVLDAELKEGAILLRSNQPPVDDDQAQTLLQYIQASDASKPSWVGRDVGKKYRFKILTAGRVSSY